MKENKVKFALWVRPKTMKSVESLYKEDNCKSKSEYIEKAIDFYSGYLISNKQQEYLPNILVSIFQGIVDSFEDRMASMLFKLAVEISMANNITAASNGFDIESLNRLRGKCVEEVKKIHGSISFENAARFQKS